MGPFEGVLYGFAVALTPTNILAALAGALIGTLVGVLPGIGPVGAMALLLPVTLTMGPVTALVMLAGIFYGSQFGGSTTAILVNMPGEASSMVTTIDGYQMAQKGRAGAALAVSAVGSFVAGTLGVVGLTLFAPPLAEFALAFGPPEYFAIALLGLFTLSRLSGGSFWKSVFALALGLALATVGMEHLGGYRRYTFGLVELDLGIGLVPVLIGLFGLAEVLLIAEQAGGLPTITGFQFRELFPSLAEWRRAFPPMLRATAIGFPLGLIPGPSPLISTFASYRLERRLAKNPGEFGHGAIEGVAGPEAANNAATSGMMVPLLALGIPFGGATALLLAGMMIHGVDPGPLLMQQRPDVFWGFVSAMYLGNLALLILNLPLVGLWVSLLRLPQSILVALIVIFALVGAYAAHNSGLDLIVLAAMGTLGYVLRKLRFDLAPMVLGLILGPMIEASFRQGLYMSRGDPLMFFQRPISGALLAILLAVLVVPSIRQFAARRTAAIEAVP